jgi:hypothetical protein
LQNLDAVIGQAPADEQDPGLAATARAELDAFTAACEDDAIVDTKAALENLRAVRGGYAGGLQKSLNSLRIDGYDPAAIDG